MDNKVCGNMLRELNTEIDQNIDELEKILNTHAKSVQGKVKASHHELSHKRN